VGPLFFDPQGADFTAWVNHFKNEVYRNWIVPQSALLGLKGGRVDIEFRVARDGRLVGLRLVGSSGTGALDRSARNALMGSRLLPLPSAFGPDEVAMSISFFYNERPPAS
jgi:TonB family protein